MLVVISDLHFSDETAGNYNLSNQAFTSVFVSDILALAKVKQAKEIKLVLLGDVVDLLLTREWFHEPMENRPWGEVGLRDVEQYQHLREASAVENRSLHILEQIHQVNREAFAFFKSGFRESVQAELPDIPVTITYIPGNHDRLCNLYPSLRTRLAELLGLDTEQHVDKDEHGEWCYAYEFFDEQYGVFARHGHQYDVANYGGGTDFTWKGAVQVSLGDVLTTEFFVKMIDYLMKKLDDDSDFKHEIIEYIQYVTDIRPIQQTAKWLSARIKKESNPTLRCLLEEMKDDAIDHLAHIPYVGTWLEDYLKQHHKFIHGIYKAFYTVFRFPDKMQVLRMVLRFVPLEALVGFLTGSFDNDTSKDHYARAAFREKMWREDSRVKYVLYGHTHNPLQQGLEQNTERQVLYVNTGTWRPRLFTTLNSEFIKMDQLTYCVFYAKDEADDVGFEWWNGNRKHEYPKTTENHLREKC